MMHKLASLLRRKWMWPSTDRGVVVKAFVPWKQKTVKISSEESGRISAKFCTCENFPLYSTCLYTYNIHIHADTGFAHHAIWRGEKTLDIEGYSVVYFERITVFEAPYHWTSTLGSITAMWLCFSFVLVHNNKCVEQTVIVLTYTNRAGLICTLWIH